MLDDSDDASHIVADHRGLLFRGFEVKTITIKLMFRGGCWRYGEVNSILLELSSFLLTCTFPPCAL